MPKGRKKNKPQTTVNTKVDVKVNTKVEPEVTDKTITDIEPIHTKEDKNVIIEFTTNCSLMVGGKFVNYRKGQRIQMLESKAKRAAGFVRYIKR